MPNYEFTTKKRSIARNLSQRTFLKNRFGSKYRVEVAAKAKYAIQNKTQRS